jgi:hypothetical protein
MIFTFIFIALLILLVNQKDFDLLIDVSIICLLGSVVWIFETIYKINLPIFYYLCCFSLASVVISVVIKKKWHAK